MKGINGPRPMLQVQGTMPLSMEAANAQHRLGRALSDNARNPQQMAKQLCERIKPVGDSAYTLNLENLDEEESACVQSMRPQAWRAFSDFADSSGGAGLQSVVLGAGITIDETIVMGLAELSAMVSLTLQPGPPVDEGLLLKLRRFDSVQITQLLPPADAVAGEPDEPGVVHIAAAARNVLVTALSHQDPDVLNSKLPNVVNWLLEKAPEIPPGHVDKLLVGFLKSAIESGHGDLVQIYADTILNSPVLRQDPDRRLALLMGLALPVSPSDWRPVSEAHTGDAFPIGNAAAATLAEAHPLTRAYRGPPLLNRMCAGVPVRSPSAPVPQQQIAMYHGACALFNAVLRSNELTIQEQSTFCASAFPGAGGMRTAAQYAMQRGNAGLVVAMMETIIDADHLPVAHQAALFDSLRVGPKEVLEKLLPLEHLPDQEWVKDALSSLEFTQVAQILR